MPSKNTPESIFARLDVGLCWVWTGKPGAGGYAVVRIDGAYWRVHRWVWTFLVGTIPDDLELDHLCRNRACANPDHMEPVTHQENVRRSAAGQVAADRQRAKTECPRGHAYTEENTYVNSKGSRDCKRCRRAALIRHRARKKATA